MRRFSLWAGLCLAAAVVRAENLPSEPYPTEVGLYAKDARGHWEELPASVFNWQSGGAAKSLASLGVIKGDVNAQVWGSTAPYDASYEDQFLVVAPPGVSIGEYQLIALHEHKNRREFRMLTGGVLHHASGANRDRQELVFQKVAPQTYLVSFKTYQGGGQFGLVPPPSYQPTAYSTGRIYCFTMRN